MMMVFMKKRMIKGPVAAALVLMRVFTEFLLVVNTKSNVLISPLDRKMCTQKMNVHSREGMCVY